MTIKSLFASICMGFVTLSMQAEEEASHYLHIQTSGGWTVLDLDSVDKLTFGGGNMTATDKDQKVVGTFPQESLASMYVDEKKDQSGIEDAMTDETAATFRYDADNAVVTMAVDGEIAVWSVDGSRLVFIPDAKASDTIDISAVSENVIIIKSGNYTLKTVRK